VIGPPKPVPCAEWAEAAQRMASRRDDMPTMLLGVRAARWRPLREKTMADLLAVLQSLFSRWACTPSRFSTLGCFDRIQGRYPFECSRVCARVAVSP